VSESSLFPLGMQIRIRSRSMGVKLIVVCGLALLMTVPAFFVGGLVDDRTTRAAEVVSKITGHVGGQQTFLGPTLAIPYYLPPQLPTEFAKHGTYLVFPAQASAVLKTKTEQRRLSLFKVPVFQADLNLDATFDLRGVPAEIKAYTPNWLCSVPRPMASRNPTHNLTLRPLCDFLVHNALHCSPTVRRPMSRCKAIGRAQALMADSCP